MWRPPLTILPAHRWATGPVDPGMSRPGNLSELSTAIPPGLLASARSGRRGPPSGPPEAPIKAAQVDRAVPGSTRRLAHQSHDGLCHSPADRAPTIPSPLVALKGLDVPRIERTDGIRPRRREGFIATCCNGNLVAAEFSNSPTTDHVPNAGEHELMVGLTACIGGRRTGAHREALRDHRLPTRTEHLGAMTPKSIDPRLL